MEAGAHPSLRLDVAANGEQPTTRLGLRHSGVRAYILKPHLHCWLLQLHSACTPLQYLTDLSQVHLDVQVLCMVQGLGGVAPVETSMDHFHKPGVVAAACAQNIFHELVRGLHAH